MERCSFRCLAFRSSVPAQNHRRLIFAGMVLCGIVAASVRMSWADSPFQWSSLLMEDCFEIGDLHLWEAVSGKDVYALKSDKQSDNGSVSLSQDVSRSGRNSLKMTGGGTAELSASFIDDQAYGEFYGRLSFYLGTDFSVDGKMSLLAPATSSNGPLIYVVLKNSGGNFSVGAYTYSGLNATGTTPIGRGVWHTVEFHYAVGSGNGAFTIWLDGAAAPEVKAQNVSLNVKATKLVAGADGDVSKWQGTFYIDDVVAAPYPLRASGKEVFLVYPDFRGRIGAKVIAILAGTDGSDRVIATLDGKTVFEKAAPPNKRMDIPVDLKNLPAGNHAFTVYLRNSSNVIADSSTYAFDKSYSGDPSITVDADNNFIGKDGKKFFPVTSFGQELGEIPEWKKNNYCNFLMGIGWNDEDFGNYLNTAQAQGFAVAGPAHSVTPDAVKLKPDDITSYINLYKKHTTVAWWLWREEPDNWGYDADVVKVWWDIGKKEDPARLTENVFMGYSYHDSNMKDLKSYCWPHLVGDIYGWDAYPMAHWSDPEPYGLKEFAEGEDRSVRWNWDLVPTIPFIQTAGYDPKVGNHWMPTAAEILHMCWLMVVHGAKGIHWYPYAMDDHVGHPTDVNYKGMADFTEQANDLAAAILGETPANVVVKDNADADHRRVDILTKKAPNGDIYVFTVRLTEPNEKDSFSVTFTVSGVTEAVEELVYMPAKSIRPVSPSCATFSDVFAPNQVRIYRIKSGSPVMWPGPSLHPLHDGSLMIYAAEQSLRMKVTLATARRLRAGLYDMRGREVQVLADADYSAGVHWLHCALPIRHGLYVAKVRSGNDILVKKVVLARGN